MHSTALFPHFIAFHLCDIFKTPMFALENDIYTNLAELYNKADDQPKAEKFREQVNSL